MEYALQPHLYRNVPVYLWPWLFWQLFAIALWVEQTGRDVMLAVARNGRVHIRHISEDPENGSPHTKSRFPCAGRGPCAAPGLIGWRLGQDFPFDPTHHGDQFALVMRLRQWPPTTPNPNFRPFRALILNVSKQTPDFPQPRPP